MSGVNGGASDAYKTSSKDRKIENKLAKLPMTHGGFIYFKARTQHNKKAKKSNKKKGK